MSLDVLSNYREATVGTTLNNTDPAGTSDNITVSAVTSTWVNLAAGQQMRVMDKADLGATSGYEIMVLTADNAGVAGTWTVTRGAEGSTVKTHTANWTLVPASTAGGLGNSTVGGAAFGLPLAGSWVSEPNMNSGGNMNPQSGELYAVPFVVPQGGWPPIQGLGFQTQSPAGSTGAVVRLGLYADNGSQQPGALLVDAGTVAATSGYASLSVTLGSPLSLGPGLYWRAFVVQGAPATVPTVNAMNHGSPVPFLAGSLTAVTNNGGGGVPIAYVSSLANVTGALPSTFPAMLAVTAQPQGAGAAYPLVAVGF